MAVNVELLNKVMEHIEAYPEDHHPLAWVVRTHFGTTYCFGGRTAAMCGWEPVLTGDENTGELIARMCTRDGEVVTIEAAAARELGLEDNCSRELFHPRNSREKLRELVDELTRTGTLS